MVAAATLAVALLVAIVVVGGLRWGGDEPVTAPRVVADVALADNLGAISSGSGAVWTVDTATNQILRLDPRTRRVQARVGIGGPGTVTAGAGAVWALTERRLLRIDPATNRITARTALRFPGGAPLSPIEVQILDGVPWVVGLEGALRINARDGRIESATRLQYSEPGPLFMAASDDSLWILRRASAWSATPWPPAGRPASCRSASPARSRCARRRTARSSSHARARSPAPTPATAASPGGASSAPPSASRCCAAPRSGSTPPTPAGATASSSSTSPRVRSARRRRSRSSASPAPTLVGRQLWITTPGGRLMVLQR